MEGFTVMYVTVCFLHLRKNVLSFAQLQIQRFSSTNTERQLFLIPLRLLLEYYVWPRFYFIYIIIMPCISKWAVRFKTQIISFSL